jgi:hypothetical protein
MHMITRWFERNRPSASISEAFLIIGIVLLTGAGCGHRIASGVKTDPSVRVEERRQRSITEDPAVRGDFPDTWLIADAQKRNVRHGSPEEPGESEIAEFAELFKNTKAPKILEAELLPGATRVVELPLAGPAGLAGSAQWIGTPTALKVAIAVNGSILTTGTAYRIGTARGGSHLQAQTPVGGRAIMSVTNTSPVRVKIRILLTATAR